MQVFETIPKQWGNSLGITIPKEVIEKENISIKKKSGEPRAVTTAISLS